MRAAEAIDGHPYCPNASLARLAAADLDGTITAANVRAAVHDAMLQLDRVSVRFSYPAGDFGVEETT